MWECNIKFKRKFQCFNSRVVAKSVEDGKEGKTMHKTLVILAAGMGTRFGGGIKQLTSVDDHNHLIIDYSIHDAIAAGFDKIVFIIRKDIERDFCEVIGNRIESIAASAGVEISYAYQEITDVPEYEGKEKNIGRIKPWGTGHAVLCAADQIASPFAVINADDYYGKHGFVKASKFLTEHPDGYALVGYQLKNTLSDNGGVTRGICSVNQGQLVGIKETKNIVKTENGAAADGTDVDMDSLVSMNFWCYPQTFLEVLQDGFPKFLSSTSHIEKDEYLLPIIADGMLKTGVDFSVLPTDDHWFGVTYKEDKPTVEEAFRELIKAGEYHEDLYADL